MNWYIVQAYSGFENKVADTIKDIMSKNSLESSLGEILVPTQKVTEVILALRTTMEGQTTSHVIADKLESLKLDVTRLAQGIPIGGEVHYLDENTLNTAFQSRKKII